MIEKIKQNLALTIGLAIPVAMVLLIAGMVYLPRIFMGAPVPAYDFVYAQGENIVYPSQMSYANYPTNPCVLHYYVIEKGLLIKKPNTQSPENTMYCKGQPIVDAGSTFYRRDTVANKSTQMSFEEASLLLYVTGPKSPDGFEVVHGGSGGFFPFFYGSYDYSTQYLKKGSFIEKLDMQIASDRYYNGSENNLGWVLRTPTN